jgi:hypothetical protein
MMLATLILRVISTNVVDDQGNIAYICEDIVTGETYFVEPYPVTSPSGGVEEVEGTLQLRRAESLVEKE